MEDSPGASESSPTASNEFAFTVIALVLAADVPLQMKTSATDSLSPLFTRINFPRAEISAEPPTNHWLAAGSEQIVPPAHDPGRLCQTIGVMPCASTRIGSVGTGKRRARDFTNFADVEPTRRIFVSCEPTET